MKTTLTMLAISLLCFLFAAAACATPEQTTAAIAAAGSRALSISKHGKIGKMAKAGA